MKKNSKSGTEVAPVTVGIDLRGKDQPLLPAGKWGRGRRRLFPHEREFRWKSTLGRCRRHGWR